MPCLLMSVKVTKSKDSTQSEAQIIGTIDKIYTFSKIADFQYLPMCSNVISKSTNSNHKQSSNNEGETKIFVLKKLFQTFYLSGMIISISQ